MDELMNESMDELTNESMDELMNESMDELMNESMDELTNETDWLTKCNDDRIDERASCALLNPERLPMTNNVAVGLHQ